MPKLIPTRDEHIVVIGAGMGGLAAAIRLAAGGLAVTLVEAASGPGGKMRALPSVAGPVDAGPTVLTMRDVFEHLFQLGGTKLEDHLRLVAQPVLARHFWTDGACLDLRGDRAADGAAIRAFAGPAAEAEFHRFDARVEALRHAFEACVMRAPVLRPGALAGAALAAPAVWPALVPGRSLGTLLRHAFSDPRLRQLFGRYATYVGGAPGLSPAVLAVIWQAEAQGVWAVEGGMHRLAQALARVARDLGVAMRFETCVTSLRTEGDRVIGLRLRGADGVTTELPASRVVFNGDPAALRAGLLGDALRSTLPRRATELRSLSARVWAFAGEIAGGPPLVHHNVLFADDEASEFDPILRGEAPDCPTIYICAQDRAEGAMAHGRSERFEFILNAPALPEGAPELNEDKDQCRQMTFRRLERFGLTFRAVPPTDALTTPQDFAALFPGSRGALYGRSPHGLMAPFLRPQARTRQPGLYLAGGGAHPGAGVPMAALSGLHAAEAILTDLAFRSRSGRTAMPGGISMASRTTVRAPSR